MSEPLVHPPPASSRPRKRRRWWVALLLAFGLLIGSWWLTRPRLDPRLFGSWRHVDRTSAEEITTFTADGIAITTNEKKGITPKAVKQRVRWWVNGDRLAFRTLGSDPSLWGKLKDATDEIKLRFKGKWDPHGLVGPKVVSVDEDTLVMRPWDAATVETLKKIKE